MRTKSSSALTLTLVAPEDSGSFDAEAAEARPHSGGVTFNDFHAVMATHKYIFAPTRDMWPAASVNARLPPMMVMTEDGQVRYIPANIWLDRHRPVEQLTWAPGFPPLIRHRLISGGGWIEHEGLACFNLYRPPTIQIGDPDKAQLWVDHVRRVWGDAAEHILAWLAHRVQHPEEKINHALVLGGAQGTGKDTMLEPVKQAVGPWNFSEVSPAQMLGRFNGFAKSVILRVSEARDLGDVDRFKFYDHSKGYTAAPPDVLRVDEKNLPEHSVPNICGVIITTNHKTDGIFLPDDDRRHFVAWTDLTKGDFNEQYWNRLWGWYEDGGNSHVAAFLFTLDISGFNPKAPPPKTAAFWDIVGSNQVPENAELADALDQMGNPDATTLIRIAARAEAGLALWLMDRKNSRQIPHRLEQCGLVRVRNDSAPTDGLWVINGKRQVIYAKISLTLKERFRAATKLVSGQ
jgi:Family of unknown function (DUF5906)